MLKNILSKIFNFNQQMQAKIEWQQINEPILLSWTNRGIVGSKKDIFWKKITFYGFFSCLLIFSLIVLLTITKTIIESLIGILVIFIFYTPFITLGYFGIFEFKYYTYRITEKELEIASWKEDLLFGKQLAQGLLFIITPFLVIVFITDPSALLVSLGGMAGVGILAGATLFSKGYIESHLNYEYLLTHLDTIEKLKIDKSRRLILLVAKNFNHKKQQSRIFNLFCTEENFNQLTQLVTEKATINNVEVIYGQAYAPN